MDPWSVSPETLPVKSERVCAASLKQNDIIVAVGSRGLCHFYFPRYQRWEALPPMKQWRYDCGLIILGNEIFVAGGFCGDPSSVERLKLDDGGQPLGGWEAAREMMQGRDCCTAAVVKDQVVVVGGFNVKSDSCLSSAEVFDPLNNTWNRPPDMATKRRGCAVIAKGERVFVFGGHDGINRLNSAEYFSSTTNEWKRLPPMSKIRSYPSAVAIGAWILVVGGRDEKGNYQRDVEVLDTKTMEWQGGHNVPSLNTGRWKHGAAVMENKIFVIGGHGDDGDLDTMEVLEMRENDLQCSPPMALAHSLSNDLNSLLPGLGHFEEETQTGPEMEMSEEQCAPLQETPRAPTPLGNALFFFDNNTWAERLITRSGQAEVFYGIRQLNHKIKQDVAIKVFCNNNAEEDWNTELANLIALPSHSNVMEMLSFDHIPRPAYIMRFIHGGTLRQYLDSHGRFVQTDARKILIQIGEGLSHLHEHGVVHRDLKSPNILMERLGNKKLRPVLIDLGLSKTVVDRLSKGVTSGGKGTAYWMAPEMARRMEWGTFTDMYAMGIIMWEILTGKMPFQGMSNFEAIAAALDGKRPSVNLLTAVGATKAQVNLVKALWHKDPKKRPSIGTFSACVEELFDADHSRCGEGNFSSCFAALFGLPIFGGRYALMY